MKNWLSALIEKKVQEKLAASLEKKTPYIPKKPIPPVKEHYQNDEEDDPHDEEMAVTDTLEHMKKLRDTMSMYKDNREDDQRNKFLPD